MDVLQPGVLLLDLRHDLLVLRVGGVEDQLGVVADVLQIPQGLEYVGVALHGAHRGPGRDRFLK